VDAAHFEKIASAATAKEAWDTLEKSRAGGDKLKKARLQTLRRQFELLQMRNLETISEYFTKVLSLTSSMKRCGYKISDLKIIER